MAAIGQVSAKAGFEFGGSCRRKAFRVQNREALARLERMDPRRFKGWLANFAGRVGSVTGNVSGVSVPRTTRPNKQVARE